MTNDNNKPGADAPGEKKKLARHPTGYEAARAALVPAASDAHGAAASLRRRQAGAIVDPALDGGASGTDADHLAARMGRRQAEAVVDPHLDDTCERSITKSLIAVLSPEAVVRLVLFAGRIARRQGKPLPPNIAERLGEALARGDAAAPALRDWAIRIGVLTDSPSVTPVGSRDTDYGLPDNDRVTEHHRATMRAVMLSRHLRERLGMSRPALRAQARRKTSLGSRPAKFNDSDGADPAVNGDPGRRS